MTDDDQTTRELWLAIEGLFRANRQSRAIFLSHDFHSMTLGDSTIAEYCGRMKTLADALRDVGHPIQDSQLVLNLLRVLNPRFTTTTDDIANSIAGFPSFNQVRDMLALKELRLANEEVVSNSTALFAGNASSSSSGCPGGCRPPVGSVQPGGSSTNGGSRSGSGGRTGGGGGSKRRAAAASRPHPATLAPPARGSVSVLAPPPTALQASNRPTVRAAGAGAPAPLVFWANPRRPTLPTSPLRRPPGIKRDSSLP